MLPFKIINKNKFIRMKCPNCNVNLVMTERSGAEIDYCPECRGIWLDRGELDKIIERSEAVSGYNGNGRPAMPVKGYPVNNSAEYRKKNRGSFFNDLFDF